MPFTVTENEYERTIRVNFGQSVINNALGKAVLVDSHADAKTMPLNTRKVIVARLEKLIVALSRGFDIAPENAPEPASATELPVDAESAEEVPSKAKRAYKPRAPRK